MVLPLEVFDLASLYQQLSLSNQLAGHEVFERFYELGSVGGRLETEQYFRIME